LKLDVRPDWAKILHLLQPREGGMLKPWLSRDRSL
jgi:hypothetical protein